MRKYRSQRPFHKLRSFVEEFFYQRSQKKIDQATRFLERNRMAVVAASFPGHANREIERLRCGLDHLALADDSNMQIVQAAKGFPFRYFFRTAEPTERGILEPRKKGDTADELDRLIKVSITEYEFLESNFSIDIGRFTSEGFYNPIHCKVRKKFQDQEGYLVSELWATDALGSKQIGDIEQEQEQAYIGRSLEVVS